MTATPTISRAGIHVKSNTNRLLDGCTADWPAVRTAVFASPAGASRVVLPHDMAPSGRLVRYPLGPTRCCTINRNWCRCRGTCRERFLAGQASPTCDLVGHSCLVDLDHGLRGFWSRNPCRVDNQVTDCTDILFWNSPLTKSGGKVAYGHRRLANNHLNHLIQ